MPVIRMEHDAQGRRSEGNSANAPPDTPTDALGAKARIAAEQEAAERSGTDAPPA